MINHLPSILSTVLVPYSKSLVCNFVLFPFLFLFNEESADLLKRKREREREKLLSIPIDKPQGCLMVN